MAEKQMTRRDFFKNAAKVAAGVVVGSRLLKPDAASAAAAQEAAAKAAQAAQAAAAEAKAKATAAAETHTVVEANAEIIPRKYELPSDFVENTGRILKGNNKDEYLLGIAGGKLKMWNLSEAKDGFLGIVKEIGETTEYAAAVNPEANPSTNPTGIEIMFSRKGFFDDANNIYWIDNPQSEVYFKIGYAGKDPRGMSFIFTETDEHNPVRIFTALKKVGTIDQAFIGLEQEGVLATVNLMVGKNKEIEKMKGGEEMIVNDIKAGKTRIGKSADGKIFVEPQAEQGEESVGEFAYFQESPLDLGEAYGVQIVTRGNRIFYLYTQKYPFAITKTCGWYNDAKIVSVNGKNAVIFNPSETGLAPHEFQLVDNVESPDLSLATVGLEQATIIYKIGDRIIASTFADRPATQTANIEEGDVLQNRTFRYREKMTSRELTQTGSGTDTRIQKGEIIETITEGIPRIYDIIIAEPPTTLPSRFGVGETDEQTHILKIFPLENIVLRYQLPIDQQDTSFNMYEEKRSPPSGNVLDCRMVMVGKVLYSQYVIQKEGGTKEMLMYRETDNPRVFLPITANNYIGAVNPR